LLASLLITAVGFVLFSQSRNLAMVYIAWVGLISLAAPNVAWNASSSMVNNWFHRRKAQAMSMLGIGSSLGGVLLVPLFAFAIGQWDWRTAALLLAGLVLVFGLPAVVLTRDYPEQLGLNPDGDAGPAGDAGGTTPGTVAAEIPAEIPMRQALGTRAFWTVTGVVVCFSAAIAAVNIHMVPMLVSQGMAETTAGFALSLRAFISIPVMVSAGWLGDRIGRLVVTTVMVSLLGAGSLLLSVSVASWQLWLAVVLLAGSQGLYPLTWAAVGGLFGRRSYATIRGYIMAAAAIGATVLPAGIGYLFEWQSSYGISLLIIAGFCAASAMFMVLTPRRLKPQSAARS
jgi:MFS family permease